MQDIIFKGDLIMKENKVKKIVILIICAVVAGTLAFCGVYFFGSGNDREKAQKAAENYVYANTLADYENLDKTGVYNIKNMSVYLVKSGAYSSESEFVKNFASQFEQSFEKRADLYSYIKKITDSALKSDYGDNYKVTAEAVKTVDYSSSTLKTLKKEINSYYSERDSKIMKSCFLNPDKIKSAKTVTVSYSIKGSKKEETNKIDLIVIKYRNSFKVYNSDWLG